MKNIYFIEAKSPGANIFSKFPMPRLGSILLATILKNKGYNTKVFIEDIAAIDWNQLEDADFIGVSSITSTAPRAFQIAERFRKLGIPVAIGGPHSTFLPDESLQYADYVVRGEGEETIVELLEHLKSDKPLDTIKGLSYKRNDKFVHNPARELINNLNEAPIPDFSIVYKWEKSRVVPVATSRGCPFACRFCSVIQMFGRQYRHKSLERIMEEIKAAATQKRHMFFIDDNFAANKKRTKELLRTMIANKIKVQWSAQVRTDVAKDLELVELMAKAGCFSVYIGFESINPKTLALYNKGQGIEDIDNSIRLLKKHSINIHGMFVLGSDTDDIRTIRNTGRYAKRLDIDSIQFMMLTPLPGTPVFEELKDQGRLLHTDWSKYDAHHAVFEPTLMTSFELHVETLKAMGNFYSWYSIFRNLLELDLFYSFVGIYGKRSVSKSLSNSKGYLQNLKSIISAKFDAQTDRIRQYLAQKQGTKNIILNTASLEKTESRFFSTFLKKLDKELIVDKEDFKVQKNTLAITPLVEHLKNKHPKTLQQLSDFYEKYKDRRDSVKVVNIEATSLYKTCVNIGLLLNANSKKIRKAYEQALESIGGNEFECNHLVVLVAQ
ncbi:MAG: B12-binding domain-containing radical SAM protein [Nitrospirae bacterium]|nr:B12-binding domain-containing radical SAM protein [Nitrospirota bacterium]